MIENVETEKWGDLRRRIDDVMEVFDEIEKRLAKRNRGPNSAAILTAAVMLGKNDLFGDEPPDMSKSKLEAVRWGEHSRDCGRKYRGCAPDCLKAAKEAEEEEKPPRKKDGWVSLRRDNKGQNGL